MFSSYVDMQLIMESLVLQYLWSSPSSLVVALLVVLVATMWFVYKGSLPKGKVGFIWNVRVLLEVYCLLPSLQCIPPLLLFLFIPAWERLCD